MSTPKQAAEARAAQLGLAFVDFTRTPVAPEAVAAVGLDLCEQGRVVPVTITPEGAVIATADPSNRVVLDEIARRTGVPVYPALAEDGELTAVLARLAPGQAAPAQAAPAQAAPAQPAPGQAAPGQVQPAPGQAQPQPESAMSGVAESITRGAQVTASPGVAADPLAAADANFLSELGIDPGHVADPGESGVIHVSSLVESGAGNGADTGSGAADPLGLDLELHVNDLLHKVIELGASDLHLTAGTPPQVRVHGDLQTLDEFGEMTPNELRRMLYAILTQKQRERFENDLELDLSHPLPGKARFRVNVFQQKESVGAVMRAIPNVVVPLEKLGLPKVVRSMASYPRGLVLVTGPTGSGKSTTLASLVDIINQERPVHIMTVEDPIEFLHTHKKAIVNQREVGEDTHGFAPALKHVLRQDPDVILVGEMRDLETIQTALTAAETGHLVYATLHTQDAPQSIDRMIDVFPPHQQQQVRVQLATSLQAVMTQALVQSRDGRSRHVACEVMIATPAIRNLIREGKIYQIYSAMQAGGQYGMQTMDQSLAELVKANRITYDLALERCANESDLARLCGRL